MAANGKPYTPPRARTLHLDPSALIASSEAERVTITFTPHTDQSIWTSTDEERW